MSELAHRLTRILVVEDDAEVRSALQELLRLEGFETVAASNGLEALKLLRGGTHVDLILLDLMMPVMDGWEFRLEQKKSADLADIPVVALSADQSAKAAAIDAGAYVRKPYSFPELMRAIEEALQAARTRRIAHADRMAALGTLASGIAHEINNPLAFVIANLQYLEERLPRAGALAPPETEELRAVVKESLDGAERIRRIVRDVKTFAHAEEERRVPVDVAEVLASSLGVVANELRHRARVVQRLDPVPPVLATPAWLSQVFVHLLLNAAHAVSEGSAASNEVRVHVRPSGPARVAIEVKDSGRGIPADVRHRVFDPFFTTKPVGAGAGLGLSVVHGIVSALDGELSLDSEPGRGTTVRVTLPAAPREGPAAGASAGAKPEKVRKKLLVVEDEPALARAFQRMLRTAHDVTVSLSGSEALAALADGEAFDAILCDLLMPEMTGMDLHEQVRTRFPGVEKRIVFMTGGAFTQRAREFLGSVANPSLPKPFDLQDVEAAIERLPAA